MPTCLKPVQLAVHVGLLRPLGAVLPPESPLPVSAAVDILTGTKTTPVFVVIRPRTLLYSVLKSSLHRFHAVVVAIDKLAVERRVPGKERPVFLREISLALDPVWLRRLVGGSRIGLRSSRVVGCCRCCSGGACLRRRGLWLGHRLRGGNLSGRLDGNVWVRRRGVRVYSCRGLLNGVGVSSRCTWCRGITATARQADCQHSESCEIFHGQNQNTAANR